jgi:hypothetical protein
MAMACPTNQKAERSAERRKSVAKNRRQVLFKIGRLW